ncbi:MAG TPA: hypothetical protein VKF60_06180 [Myxococcota bacterium]|nr:hypothetical protein [Myxococcota bacterium]
MSSGHAGTGNALLGGAGSSWCRFTVTKGSVKSIRATAVYDNGVTYIMSIPAH